MVRWLAGLVVLLLVLAGAVFYISSRETAPLVTFEQPDRVVGQTGTLTVTAETPGAKFKDLTVTLEQNGQTTPLFALGGKAGDGTISGNTLRISRPLGKQSVPSLRAGTARIVVSATRASFLNLHTLTTTATRDVQVRLDPPRISIVSTHHYVNHGGSEMVVYRATPPEAASGVRVGDIEYPGFAVGSDPAVKAAFFALLYNQPMNTKIVAFARDEAGNEAKASFVDNVFDKPQKKSRIEIDDRFMDRVVPEIIEHSPELKMAAPPPGPDMIPAFVRVNSDLRQMNAETIQALARQTSPTKLWDGPFVPLGNSKVEAAFADHRTYLHNGKEIDQQVHLGFDLAVTAHVPIVAANAGTVLNASWLGIYGNCVVIDHGMGVQSLYGHLSAFDVKVGDKVSRGQTLGRSGMTGMAGGDHLHFTMLVNGRMVNPVEWWDPHWIEDRVLRKLGDAGGRPAGR